MARMPVKECATMSRNLLLLGVMMIGAAYCQADKPPVAMELSTRNQHGKALGDTEVQIRITNTSDHRITLQTKEADPPIMLFSVPENGQDAIISRPSVK